jgi:flagellin
MSSQINGMVQANRNTQDANNLIQAAESGLSDISDILSRMRELAVQASTDTLNDVDRASINLEFQTFKNELTRIADATEYNEMNILNGTYQTGTPEVGSYAPNSQSHIDRVAQDNPNDFTLSERGFWQLQVGADNDANNQIELNIINATAEGLGLTKYDYQPQQVQKTDAEGNLLYIDTDGNETTDPTSTVNNAPAMETINNPPSMGTINNPPAVQAIDNTSINELSEPFPVPGVPPGFIQKVDAEGNPLYIDPDGNETTSPTSNIQKVDVEGNLIYIDTDGNETTSPTSNIQKVGNGNPLYIDTDGNETTSSTSTVNNTPAMETMNDAPYQKNINYDTNVLTVDDSRQVITTLDNAIDEINQERSYLGSMQNKLQFTMSNLTSQIQSIESSRSSIEDVDFAIEASDLAKNQILAQSGTAMLAQASAISQNILSLIAA